MASSSPSVMNHPAEQRSHTLVIIVCLVGIVAIFLASFLLAKVDPKDTEAGEAFGGTDGAVAELIDSEYEVNYIFQPLFDLGSGELESGLFAVQAAIGAGIVGFVLGNLRGRTVMRNALAAPPGQDTPPGHDAGTQSAS